MTRIDWASVGARFFEVGVDRGVLYVANDPGVPWVGLVAVNHAQSGGSAKPHYLDGVKIGNHAGPEEFEGKIEAFSHPTMFEQCDGTALLQNGLRVTQQRRKSFGVAYRTRVGNDLEGPDHKYKIHLLYNLRAEPSERGYQTLGDEVEPMNLTWNLTSRGEMVTGLRPVSHFEIDSRDVPAELLQQVEDILYGTSEQQPSLPTPGEIIFLFDSFEDEVYDAGTPYTPVFAFYDAGSPSTPITFTIDGGTL